MKVSVETIIQLNPETIIRVSNQSFANSTGRDLCVKIDKINTLYTLGMYEQVLEEMRIGLEALIKYLYKTTIGQYGKKAKLSELLYNKEFRIKIGNNDWLGIAESIKGATDPFHHSSSATEETDEEYQKRKKMEASQYRSTATGYMLEFQRLIDSGMLLVDKLSSSDFIDSQTPTEQFSDQILNKELSTRIDEISQATAPFSLVIKYEKNKKPSNRASLHGYLRTATGQNYYYEPSQNYYCSWREETDGDPIILKEGPGKWLYNFTISKLIGHIVTLIVTGDGLKEPLVAVYGPILEEQAASHSLKSDGHMADNAGAVAENQIPTNEVKTVEEGGILSGEPETADVVATIAEKPCTPNEVDAHGDNGAVSDGSETTYKAAVAEQPSILDGAIIQDDDISVSGKSDSQPETSNEELESKPAERADKIGEQTEAYNMDLATAKEGALNAHKKLFNESVSAAISYLDSGQYDLAKDAISSALSYYDPSAKDYDFLTLVADVYRSNDLIGQAMDYADQAIAINPLSAHAYYIKAQIYVREVLRNGHPISSDEFQRARDCTLQAANALIGWEIKPHAYGLLASLYYYAPNPDIIKAEEYAKKAKGGDASATKVLLAIERSKEFEKSAPGVNRITNSVNGGIANSEELKATDRASTLPEKTLPFDETKMQGECNEVSGQSGNTPRVFEGEKARSTYETWGPKDRPTYTWAEPADHVTFNSITDSPTIGDERNFVRVKKYGTDDTFSDLVNLEVGAEYEVFIYYHNNASANLNDSGKGIASNVRLYVDQPNTLRKGEAGAIRGTIYCAQVEEDVWDTAWLHADSTVLLRYVANSATIHTLGSANGSVIDSNALFGETGAYLAYSVNHWGIVPGCNEYSGYVTYRFIVDQPGFRINCYVKHPDETQYGKEITAKPGDILDFMIEYHNTGTINQLSIIAYDHLPDGLEYIEGSSFFSSNFNEEGNVVSDKLFHGGINLGDYKPGDFMHLEYKVKVLDDPALSPQGKEIELLNDVSVATQNGTGYVKALVKVKR